MLYDEAIVAKLRPRLPHYLVCRVTNEAIWGAWEETNSYDCGEGDNDERIELFVELLGERIAYDD
jgi:hypothetical protein